MYHYAGNNPIKYTDPDGKNVAVSFLKGFWDAGVDEVTSIKNIVSDIPGALTDLYDSITSVASAIINDPKGFGKALYDTATLMIGEFIDGSADDKAYAIGRVAENLVIAYLTGKAVGKIKELFKNFKFAKPINSVKIGQAGENAVRSNFNIGEKIKIKINGRTRIPDGLSDSVLSEVKNVKKQSFTRQLHDYLDFAEGNNLRMDLYVRPNTKLSQPLYKTIKEGRIHLNFIPE